MKTMSHLHFILIILAITSSSAFAQNNVSMVDGTMNDTASYNAIGWGLIILLLIQVLVLRSLSSAIRSVSNSDIFKNNSKFFQNILVIGGVLFSFHSFAQGAGSSEPLVSFSELDIYILIALNFLLSLIVIWMYYQFQQILKYAGILKEEEPKSTIWDIEHWLTKSVPIEKEATIQFDHEYDGIRELDNVLPPWWLWMFYATIIFSVVYLVHYHITPIKALEKIGFVGPGVGQEELYKIEMEQAEKEKQAYLAQVANKINEENVTKLTDPAEINQGKEIFMTNCITCHGKEAQGGAGPNLTDEYWLHGGGIKNIFKVIKYGVPAKGMIAWETQLSPKQIQQVASYILTLKGTNPPGAKEPQGELWKEEAGADIKTEKTDTLSNNKQN